MTVEQFVREPSVATKELKGSLPPGPVEDGVDCKAIANDFVSRLANLKDADVLADALWADWICMTGTIRVLYSSKTIASLWAKLAQERSPSNFSVVVDSAQIMKMPGAQWITASFTFELNGTPACKCSGNVGVVPDQSGDYKIWYLTTMLEEIRDLPNPDTPPVVSKGQPSGDLDCLVVGGSTCGLQMGSRLQAMGLKYLVLDKASTVAGTWAGRYDNLKFHLNKYFSEVPYESVFSEKQYYMDRDELVDGYRQFARRWNLNIQQSAEVDKASWDPDAQHWTVKYRTDGRPSTVIAKHLIIAIGSGCEVPHVPDLPGRELFAGEVIHSSRYKNAKGWKGKKAVIVGVGSSGTDAAEGMVEENLASVTLIQRRHTSIFPMKDVDGIISQVYNDKIDINVADRLMYSRPYGIMRLIGLESAKLTPKANPGRYDAVRAAGFLVYEDPEPNRNVLERFGGHLLDTGVTDLIAEGKIKVKSGHEPVEFTKSGLRLSSGEEVEADIILFATGYRGNMRKSTADIVGQEVADQLQDFWGLNPEGVIRGLGCPIGHPNIWYMGGGTTQSRFYSRFTALQIKAEVEGIPFKAYPMEV